ncbi:MAG: phosphorothioated DNA-binding restriction endonuclease [Bacteroidota bacterium]
MKFDQEFDKRFTQLLKEFGTSKSPSNSHHPFWYLRNDNIWELSGTENLRMRKGKEEPLKTSMLHNEVFGGFPKAIYDEVVTDHNFLIELAEGILDKNFPPSIYGDISDAMGLDLSRNTISKKKRDPAFREKVLRAYEYQCAICGFDLRLGNMSVGLEAAHIQWHQAGGPDVEENGICLCVLHHKFFDLGGFTIDEQMSVRLSQHLFGRQGFSENFRRFHHKRIIEPQRKNFLPALAFLEWHQREVFKKPFR